jgi:hypothetical protein
MKDSGHFVQTFLPVNAYRALHSQAKRNNMTLDRYLRGLIINSLTKERSFNHGEDASDEKRFSK